MNKQIISAATVAKWFETTPNNIRTTYRNKKQKVYLIMQQGTLLAEHGITDEELFFMIDTIERARKLCTT